MAGAGHAPARSATPRSTRIAPHDPPRLLPFNERSVGIIRDQLDIRLDELFRGLGPGGRQKVALVGLRGAGKSTVGTALAQRLGAVFVELDAEVEAEAGMSLSEIFELHGEGEYRALELAVLDRVLSEPGAAVIAAQERHERVVQVGTQQRNMPHLIEAREILRTGQLGSIHKIRLSWNRNANR